MERERLVVSSTFSHSSYQSSPGAPRTQSLPLPSPQAQEYEGPPSVATLWHITSALTIPLPCK